MQLEQRAPQGALRGLSSMATRMLLADLAQWWRDNSGWDVQFESVGGVTATQRIAAGETVDVVVLDRDAIERLAAAGLVQPESVVAVARSPLAAAVAATAQLPDWRDSDAVRASILSAPRIGYSTGPSGRVVAQWLQRWGIAEVMRDRVVVAPPGVPVGVLLARGEVDLAFQQRSELQGIAGIQLVPALPPELAAETIFSAALARTCTQPEASCHLLSFLVSTTADAIKQRHGMLPARHDTA